MGNVARTPAGSAKVVVVDTNVMLHFLRLDDKKWDEQFPAPVEFVITATVVAELDDHKRSSTLRIQRRARELLPWIEEHDGKAIREGVTLTHRVVEPHQILRSTPQLDPGNDDDRIVAAAMELRAQNPEARIIVVSDDTGLRAKARAQEFHAESPADACRLPRQPTEEERELAEACRRIQLYESQAPKLSLSVPGDGPSPVLQIGPEPESEETYDQRLQKTLSRYGTELGSHYTQRRIDEYAAFFRELEDVINLASCCVCVPLVIGNDGTHHADGIRVELSWSGPLTFLLELPDPPRLPKKPGLLSGIMSPMPIMPNLDISRSDKPSGPHGADGGTTATYDVPRLVHGTSTHLDPLLLVFDSFAGAKGFGLDWTIHAAHQNEPATGQLNIRVLKDRSHEDMLRLLGVEFDDD